jgi:hypothetical protein
VRARAGLVSEMIRIAVVAARNIQNLPEWDLILFEWKQERIRSGSDAGRLVDGISYSRKQAWRILTDSVGGRKEDLEAGVDDEGRTQAHRAHVEVCLSGITRVVSKTVRGKRVRRDVSGGAWQRPRTAVGTKIRVGSRNEHAREEKADDDYLKDKWGWAKLHIGKFSKTVCRMQGYGRTKSIFTLIGWMEGIDER